MSEISSVWQRLPSDVIPLHYDLCLVPDLQNCTFVGHVDITLTVKVI